MRAVINCARAPVAFSGVEYSLGEHHGLVRVLDDLFMQHLLVWLIAILAPIEGAVPTSAGERRCRASVLADKLGTRRKEVFHEPKDQSQHRAKDENACVRLKRRSVALRELSYRAS